MKTFSVFARYFAVLAMLFLTSQSAYSQPQPPPDPCPPDGGCVLAPGYPPEQLEINICSYDALTDEFCCLLVTYTKRVYSCPLPPLRYRYDITRIEVIGSCFASNVEITKEAIKAIMVASSHDGALNPQVTIPSCIGETFPDSGIWIPCSPNCCIADFEVAYDTLTGDYVLYNIFLNDDLAAICGDPTEAICKTNCNMANIPAPGRLHVSEKLPPACTTSCPPDATIPYSWASFNDGVDNLSGLYSIGYDGNGIPCISFHYFWDIHKTKTPQQTIETLVKIALKDVWDKSALPKPQFIKLNIWSCVGTTFPTRKLYAHCLFGVECCTITFEINEYGDLATVYDRTSGDILCEDAWDPYYPYCFSPCGFFNSGPYSIPKLSVNEVFDESNKGIKVIPNPTTGVFNIEFDMNSTGTHTIKVVDLLGIEMFNQTTEVVKRNNSISIDLTNIPSGTYYVQIIQNGQIISNAKFIKN